MVLIPSKWTWWQWTLIILGIIIILPKGFRVVNWLATRGKRLTRSTSDENGNIIETPEQLAASASSVVGRVVSVDEYALARMLASEEGSATPSTKVAIAWVAVNEARRRGKGVSDMLDDDTGTGEGQFGVQLGKYASTRTDPYEIDLQVATEVLSGNVPDPTNGAIHFYRPTLQDKLLSLGKVRKSAAQVDSDWGGSGFKVSGVDSGITFYRPA